MCMCMKFVVARACSAVLYNVIIYRPSACIAKLIQTGLLKVYIAHCIKLGSLLVCN